MKAIAVFAVAMLLIVPLSIIQTLFLMFGWWLCHDFLHLPMLRSWQALGMCLVANTLIKSQLNQSK